MKFIKLADNALEMLQITGSDSTLPLLAMQKGIAEIYIQSSDNIEGELNKILGDNTAAAQTTETNYVELIDEILGETL